LQSENDIIDALEEGLLTSATLDVFATEPLPSTSPLWTHPKITITPHNAAFSHPRAIVANMLGQIERFERGEPFTNVVNRDVGY
jgi:glyoxylate/hydroxypyruvate reductase A